MPSHIIIMTLLSTLSFLYSIKVFGQEVQRLQTIVQPFGGNPQRRMEPTLRLSIAALFTALTLLSMLISGALIWLSMQPGLTG